MPSAAIESLIERQRSYFATGKTKPIAGRAALLRKLKTELKGMEAEFITALKADLNKSAFESFSSEIGVIYGEIAHVLKHLDTWARPQSVATPLVLQPASSHIHPQPKGVVLIIGPWNYPLNLILAPLVGAIAAGNCVVIKPSEMATATAAALTKLIAKTFSPEHCAVVDGGVQETTDLLQQRFDHIFFTGSIPVGRVVMRAAAENLTPVTLELGGKSPCIIDESVDIDVTARRVVWGKFFNAGQTCVAPDYLLVQRSVKAPLLAALQAQITAFFGTDPRQSPDYGRIINARHFDRLRGLMGGQMIAGGQHDRETLYIAPTLIDGVKLSDKIMEDEIFGPLLPVMTFEALDEAIAVVAQRPNPLALYLFTKRREAEERIVNDVPFGGGCINNAIVHLANPNLPFGGVGQSGMGAYHGKDSFDTFSHRKSVVRSAFAFDVKLKYPPYKERVDLMRKIMR